MPGATRGPSTSRPQTTVAARRVNAFLTNLGRGDARSGAHSPNRMRSTRPLATVPPVSPDAMPAHTDLLRSGRRRDRPRHSHSAQPNTKTTGPPPLRSRQGRGRTDESLRTRIDSVLATTSIDWPTGPTQFCCAADVNNDGAVDFQDLNNIISDFLLSGDALPSDINGDGRVDLADLNFVLSSYLGPC